jgi:hypothetical protein
MYEGIFSLTNIGIATISSLFKSSIAIFSRRVSWHYALAVDKLND